MEIFLANGFGMIISDRDLTMYRWYTERKRAGISAQRRKPKIPGDSRSPGIFLLGDEITSLLLLHQQP